MISPSVQSLSMPCEGIELIKSLLQIESPIVFSADSMDHGQGASVRLTSAEHREALDEAGFDLGFWLFELFWELCDQNATYWAGDGQYSIAQQNDELFLSLQLSKGSFAESDTPIEERFLSVLNRRLYDQAKSMDPDVDIDELMFYFDFDVSYSSEDGFSVLTSQVTVESLDDQAALSPDTVQAISNSIIADAKDAVEAFDGELPKGYSAWVQMSGKNAFTEMLASDVETYYGGEAVYKLIASCKQPHN